MKRIDIALKTVERNKLLAICAHGEHQARVVKRAQALLGMSEGLPVGMLSQALRVNRVTLRNICRAYAVGGLSLALYDDPRSGQPRKYRTEQEAELVALACSAPPQGRKRWTLALLTLAAGKRPKLGGLNRESARLMLKKTNVSLG